MCSITCLLVGARKKTFIELQKTTPKSKKKNRNAQYKTTD